MSWIQTYSGVQFYPLTPRPGDVRLEDIAHALALKCRFNGHCKTFYSVAQHSVLVAKELHRLGHIKGIYEAQMNTIRLALLHDAAEAYLPDVCRPIKPALHGFSDIEDAVYVAIVRALRVYGNEWVEEQIKHCDDVLLATEARDIMGPPPAEWDWLPPPRDEAIGPWSWQGAEEIWLDTYRTGGSLVGSHPAR